MNELFKRSYRSYGTRRLKVSLARFGIVVSRRRISRIMKAQELISKYTKKSYRVNYDNKSNELRVINELQRQFKPGGYRLNLCQSERAMALPESDS